MEVKRQGYWIGEFFDGELVIFAPELQRAEEKDWVYLWSNSTEKVEPYLKEATRDGAPPIDLVDGEHLAEKLKEFGLGIKTEMIEKVTVDKQWFRNL